ncbi:hypothetical protein [Limnohabitans sp. 2KL-51]|uniref:hypothetical protein n=1 Tax=Limnohabitans sp. 2KL-51 TaxID=1977911 RepID=UPI0011B2169C|nr:hypothetical protein [Limnohabitans sp. 2KL-51]
MKINKKLVAVIFLVFAGSGNAQTPWPTEVYQSYYNQCKASMRQQGMSEQKANGYCFCISSGFSKEFGMEQYNHLRSAQPNPNGSIYDRKLFNVATSCLKK